MNHTTPELQTQRHEMRLCALRPAAEARRPEGRRCSVRQALALRLQRLRGIHPGWTRIEASLGLTNPLSRLIVEAASKDERRRCSAGSATRAKRVVGSGGVYATASDHV